jgi:hypothetical protein
VFYISVGTKQGSSILGPIAQSQCSRCGQEATFYLVATHARRTVYGRAVGKGTISFYTQCDRCQQAYGVPAEAGQRLAEELRQRQEYGSPLTAELPTLGEAISTEEADSEAALLFASGVCGNCRVRLARPRPPKCTNCGTPIPAR